MHIIPWPVIRISIIYGGVDCVWKGIEKKPAGLDGY